MAEHSYDMAGPIMKGWFKQATGWGSVDHCCDMCLTVRYVMPFCKIYFVWISICFFLGKAIRCDIS